MNKTILAIIGIILFAIGLIWMIPISIQYWRLSNLAIWIDHFSEIIIPTLMVFGGWACIAFSGLLDNHRD